MMKRLPFLIFFLTGISFWSFGQAPMVIPKFGKIEPKDFEKKYSADTSVSAVVLFNVGESKFGVDASGLVLYSDHHVRIKILKKNGYDWATTTVPLFGSSNSDRETVMNLKGNTYNLVDGKVVTDKMPKEAVFNEKEDEFWTNQKFSLPNVKEGSIIEYSYRVKSGYIFDFPNWTFQRSIPVLYSEYTAEFPEWFDYKKTTQGYEPFYLVKSEPINVSLSASLTGTGTRYIWAMKDVPAMEEEPYMSSLKDYVARIEFELGRISLPGDFVRPMNNSWDKITTNLLQSENFGGRLKKNGTVKALTAPIIAQQTEPVKRLEAIFDYVRSNFKWNESYRVYATQTFGKLLEKKVGTSAEINLLLTAMLKEAGIEADPVILSTRGHGRINPYYPSLTKFNYTIAHAKIGDKVYLLDATEPMGTINVLPSRCISEVGRLISAENSDWVALQSGSKDSFVHHSKLVIGEDNSINGVVHVVRNGHNALSCRKSISQDGEKKYIDNLKKASDLFEIKNINLKNTTPSVEPLIIDYEVTASGQPQAGNIIYLQPMQSLGIKANPFKHETRKYPIDFTTAVEQTYMYSYTIPTGFAVEEQPKSTKVNLPEDGGSFVYSVTTIGNTINVLSKLTINRPQFLAEEYPYLKEFYNQIVAKQAEQIVLKKTIN
ncbi:DUF3857 and transglutaminase domain-containing protein [Adhaeribacter swui]|uniref:DUF3857 and transglutaminase domain-containing protein n=1 Tax=Adhaeribacter swui TaxID=2086471 RepID=A0A7G7G307_9BACT|nr:DUF3857 domain-containing protein [Adhaeribacter swui]QNF31541.1 DUF3857 and transglutaminase domain-containing protein [Adhaeribacter swui]